MIKKIQLMIILLKTRMIHLLLHALCFQIYWIKINLVEKKKKIIKKFIESPNFFSSLREKFTYQQLIFSKEIIYNSQRAGIK